MPCGTLGAILSLGENHETARASGSALGRVRTYLAAFRRRGGTGEAPSLRLPCEPLSGMAALSDIPDSAARVGLYRGQEHHYRDQICARQFRPFARAGA